MTAQNAVWRELGVHSSLLAVPNRQNHGSLDIEQRAQLLLIETDDDRSIDDRHGCCHQTQFLKFVQRRFVLADIPIFVRNIVL